MKIKTTKSTFKIVPEGDVTLLVTDVKIVPAGRPQFVEFYYSHENGGTTREKFDLNHEIAKSILGKRIDIALDGSVEEGTEFDLDDIPSMFNGKYVDALVEHNVVEKEGKKRTYANIKYITAVYGMDDEEEDDDL